MQKVNLEDAKAIITSNKLVFVDFFTSWCNPCADFAERVEKEVLPMIHDQPDVAFIKVNVESEPEQQWAESCGMVVIPTTAVFVNGKQVNVTYIDNHGETVENAQYLRGNLLQIQSIVKKLIVQYL